MEAKDVGESFSMNNGCVDDACVSVGRQLRTKDILLVGSVVEASDAAELCLICFERRTPIGKGDKQK